MSALATYGTSGSSPGLRRLAHLFEGPFRFTSIRVPDPDDFLPLPARFALVRRGGAWWLTDTSVPVVTVVRGVRS